MSRFGTSKNSGTDQDPDHDGLSNLIEYAFRLDPLRWDAAGIPRGKDSYYSTIFEYTHPEGLEDGSYGVEWSTTLLPGSWTPVADTGSGTNHYFSVPTPPKSKVFTRWTVIPR